LARAEAANARRSRPTGQRSAPAPPLNIAPIRFRIPVGDLADFDPDQPPVVGKWEYKEVTLPGQIIPPQQRFIPDRITSTDSRPSVWQTLSSFRRAAKARSINDIKQLYVADAWMRAIPADFDSTREAQLLEYLGRLADAEVPLIVEVDGRFIPILDAGNGLVKSMPLQRVGEAFLLDEPAGLPPENIAALDDLVKAMKRVSVEELVAN
jgi:hypothetical protein